MKKIFSTIAFLTLAFSATTYAQSEVDMKAWTNYMTPGEVHKMIAKSNGEWNEEVTMWMTPGAPPTVSKSIAVNEMIMGGRYQLSKHTGDMMGMPFEGMSLLGYDNIKKMFTSTWIDNFGTGTITLNGKWDDKTKTVTFIGTSLDPMTGKDQNTKQTMQMVDDNTQIMEMFTITGGKEFKTMHIKLTRK